MSKTRFTINALTAAVACASLVFTADSFAHQTSKKKKSASTVERYESSTTTTKRSSAAVDNSALESRIAQLEDELRAMRSELGRAKANNVPPEQVKKLEDRIELVASEKKEKSNMVFFRGGYAAMDKSRGDDILTSGGPLHVSGKNDDKDGYYVGAGLDFSLNDNLFGLMDNTEVLAELLLEWKKYSTLKKSGNGTPLQLALDVGGAFNGYGHDSVTVSQFTIAASPKIKFLKGNDFRPWIIPVGMAFHIVSPPTDGVTVFNPGLMFGLGADYKVWDNIFVGFDGRYHLTAGDADGTKTDGYTAGGYVGIGF